MDRPDDRHREEPRHLSRRVVPRDSWEHEEAAGIHVRRDRDWGREQQRAVEPKMMVPRDKGRKPKRRSALVIETERGENIDRAEEQRRKERRTEEKRRRERAKERGKAVPTDEYSSEPIIIEPKQHRSNHSQGTKQSSHSKQDKGRSETNGCCIVQ
ncbi:hypothetical protein OEA41_006873 [Lepraria neglecta]|uniref:Uncharacterized protein n=1 Tax=Lepraria neglecta TaxID=209136 RepID=A0AAD9ZC88_9LECA|nr:hypothetical protein OEA41_006873 [Lepraria neglecta]